MTSHSQATFFASPGRLPLEAVALQHRSVAASEIVPQMLECFPGPAALINGQRQIVLANRDLERLSGLPRRDLLGLRFGESLSCVNAHELPAGCGTAPACALCGAACAIESSQATGEGDSRDCRITIERNHQKDALDLRVWTTPVDLDGERFTVVAVRDTSSEQRRAVLERMFFHDVMNVAGALKNLLDLSPTTAGPGVFEASRLITPLVTQLIEEVRAQRDLVAAERGELEPRPELLDPQQLLRELAESYGRHAIAEGKRIEIDWKAGRTRLKSDGVLLRRVLGNLLKNALEASKAGEVVTLTCTDDGRPRFSVHNSAVLAPEVRMQVFQRSFSTKGGRGRGIGTYSARLLVDRYLGGRLTFTSAEGAGTTFTVTLGPHEDNRLRRTVESSDIAFRPSGGTAPAPRRRRSP